MIMIIAAREPDGNKGRLSGHTAAIPGLRRGTDDNT